MHATHHQSQVRFQCGRGTLPACPSATKQRGRAGRATLPCRLLLKTGVAGFVVAAAISASAVTTNVWQGAASGGLWSDQANWSETLTPTTPTVYDFSTLADGSVVTNDYVYTKTTAQQLQIAGLLFGADKGTVTLFGTATSETIFPKNSNPQIVVPAGTTFDCRLRHTTGPWADMNTKLTFPEAGTVKFTGTGFKPTMWELVFSGAGSAAVFDEVAAAFQLTRLTFTASRVTVTVNGDATFADINDNVWPSNWKTDRNMVVGDGVSTLTFCSGYGYAVSPTKYTFVTNFESVVMSGGGHLPWRGPTLAKHYVFNNMDITYGREYTKPGDLVDNDTGALQLPPQAAVDLDGSARVLTYCDQKLSTLAGTGTHGQFDVGGTWNNATDKILTPGSLTVGEGVSSATSTVFNARLTGMGGGFVKKGAGYDLTLTGENTYTGATQVAEGTLTLKRDIDYDGTAWWWSFDGADPKQMKAGPTLRNLQFVPTEQANITQIADGVRGTRAIHLDGPNDATVKLAANSPVLFSGNSPHTIQFWIRPDQAGCCVTSSRLTYIMDYGTHWGGHFTRSRVVLFRTNATGDDYLLIYTPHNFNPKEVDVGYGVNVPLKAADLFDGRWHHVAYVYGRENKLVEAYFDGELKGSDALLEEMNLPTESAKLELGYYDNNDTNYYTGDVDELKAHPRALTADEIRRAAVFADAQPALAVPTPIIHWTFSDSADIGKDECGVAPLSAVAGKTAPSLCAALHAVDGKALDKDRPMQTIGYPECMPTGKQPFTVSCRYMANGSVGNNPILWWGNPSVANHYFRLQTTSTELRSPGVGYDMANTLNHTWNASTYATPSIHHTTAVMPSNDIPSGWTDFTVSWDNKAGVLKMYVDGALVASKSSVWLNIDKSAALTVGMQTVNTTTTTLPASVDDIQIFDRVLTDEEVRLAVRQLHGENGSRVIAASSVTVDFGATLSVKGPGHSLAALAADAGTLDLAYEADFTPNAGTFALGTLTGYGLLNLTNGVACKVGEAAAFGGTAKVGAGASFAQAASGGVMAGDVVAANGALLMAPEVGASAPIRTTGRVLLPATLTVVLPEGGLNGAVLSLVESPAVTMDGANWSYRTVGGTPLDASRFKVVRTATGVTLGERRGSVLIIR